MKFASFVLSFLFAALTVSAQVNPQCPNISVTGPAGLIQPGELIPFTVTVKPTESTLTYKWTVDGGTITKGKDTATINVSVRPDASALTVSVEIGGLPDECPRTASETISDLNGSSPKAKKLDTFSLPLSSISDKRLQDVADAINDSLTSQSFIFIPASRKIRDELIARFYKFVRHGLDPPRVTLVETSADNKIIEVWLVPPGASEPTCEKCNPSATTKNITNVPSEPESSVKSSPAIKPPPKCPKITITAPSRIAMPGDVIVFRSSLSRSVPASTKYLWSVNYGKIVSGQGTRSMKVRIPIGDSSAVRASLTVSGLPKVCENFNSASTLAGIAPQPLVDPYARYGDISFETEKEKLRNAFTVLAKYPKFKLLLVRRSSKNSSKNRKRIGEIRSFIADELKVSPSRFQLATIAGDNVETVIWFVKPGTNVVGLIGTK
jgi:hypothetical protein